MSDAVELDHGEWHIQVTAVTLRYYPPGKSYAARDQFAAVASAWLMGDKAAFIHAALRVDGAPLTPYQWRKLVRKMHRELGVTIVEFDRGGDEFERIELSRDRPQKGD